MKEAGARWSPGECRVGARGGAQIEERHVPLVHGRDGVPCHLGVTGWHGSTNFGSDLKEVGTRTKRTYKRFTINAKWKCRR